MPKKTHVTELPQPITARAILVAEKNGGLVDDAYHGLLLYGAWAMEEAGLRHWHYVTGWSASTLWRSPTDPDRTLVVGADGKLS